MFNRLDLSLVWVMSCLCLVARTEPGKFDLVYQNPDGSERVEYAVTHGSQVTHMHIPPKYTLVGGFFFFFFFLSPLLLLLGGPLDAFSRAISQACLGWCTFDVMRTLCTVHFILFQAFLFKISQAWLTGRAVEGYAGTSLWNDNVWMWACDNSSIFDVFL